VIDVVVVAGDPELRHPLGDAALDARALVSGEVEAASVSDEFE
jgi:hypothetical protein